MTQHEDRKTWYEPHPVSAERKAEIRAHGFVIIDAVFKPDGYENPGIPELTQKLDGDGKSGAGDELTAAQIKEQLTAKGIPFKGNASKADLLALLTQKLDGDGSA